MAGIKKIGILGGTFDPIHVGHLVLAEQARQRLGLEKVIFVPAFLPPHKKSKDLASAKERYVMVARAIRSHRSFELSDIEIKRRDVSYSIETVRHLKKIYRKVKLYFIVGSDFLRDFKTWKSIATLKKICTFVIAERPGFPYKGAPSYMRIIEVDALGVSSSQIRRRIKKGESIRYLVPDEVRKYIERKGIYKRS